MIVMGWIMGLLIVVVLAILVSCLKIVPQAQAYVIERLGAYQGTWSVGFHVKVPFLDKVARKVNLKEQVADFPPQPVITKDNVDRHGSLLSDYGSQAVYLRRGESHDGYREPDRYHIA